METTLQQPLVWDERMKRNCNIFIISYAFMGAVTGVTNNTYVSYLNLVAPETVQGINIWAAFATLIMSAMLLFVHRLGYKKVIIASPLVAIAAMIMTIFSKDALVVSVCYILITVGVGIFDYMYPLMFSSYVPKDRQTSMMSKVMYINLITQAIVTFFGGKIVVWVFSMIQKVSYDTAATYSENPTAMVGSMLNNYIDSYKAVIYIAVIFAALSFVCGFFLKEKPSDYAETEEELKERKAKKAVNFKLLLTKDVLLWVAFLMLIRFGALLITPYFPIYLNDFLHISRGTVSTIITLQTVAMVIGYFFAPWLEKKMGSIWSIGIMTFLCIPLMLLMANGTMFGTNTALMVGIILFVRSGVANATMPGQQTMQMALVPKNLRPAFTSFITLMTAGVSFVVGLFTKYVLLVHPSGYATAYYLTSGFYLVAIILLVSCLAKKYNRAIVNNEDIEAKE